MFQLCLLLFQPSSLPEALLQLLLSFLYHTTLIRLCHAVSVVYPMTSKDAAERCIMLRQDVRFLGKLANLKSTCPEAQVQSHVAAAHALLM